MPKPIGAGQLSSVQRAFLIGRRRVLARARQEMGVFAVDLDATQQDHVDCEELDDRDVVSDRRCCDAN